MKKKLLEPYHKWIGEWVGRGVTKTDVPVTTRLVITSRLAAQSLEFLVESIHSDSNALVHGVIALMGVDPDGEVRFIVQSTIHGSIVMQVTPEDPGALAIAGHSVTGNRVVVSLVEENGGLMLTSYWRPANDPDAETVGYSNVSLKRVTPH